MKIIKIISIILIIIELIKSIKNLNYKDEFCLATDFECVGQYISNFEYKTNAKKFILKIMPIYVMMVHFVLQV